jgi:hypothetical protein
MMNNSKGREQYYGLLDATILLQTKLYDKVPKTLKNRWHLYKPNMNLPLKQSKYFKYHMSLDDLVWENIKGYFTIAGERIKEMIEKTENIIKETEKTKNEVVD